VIDWTTVASLATAGGTLVLAIATFSSVRSGNRSARIAEEALMVQTRPVLAPSRTQDDPIKVMWGDDHWARIAGGHAAVEIAGDVIYLAISVRNVGAGIAVIQGWYPIGEGRSAPRDHAPVENFRSQSRDLYVATGDVAFWQGAIREADDPDRLALTSAIRGHERFIIDVLYSDHNGRQRAITRFSLFPRADDDMNWLASTVRHWNLDRSDPR